MDRQLSDFEWQVLAALVGGYEARQGLKDRIRVLNEWEIARRAGFTEISYAGYFEHPARDRVMEALAALQRHGLVSVWERGGKYDTFVPTSSGSGLVGTSREANEENPPAADVEPVCDQIPISADPVVQRLDEIVRLLRSIDSKIGGS